MSVTFAPAGDCSVIHSFSCTGQQCGFSISSAAYWEVADAVDEHFYSCDSSVFTEEEYAMPELSVQVNTSNANARDILGLLGIESEELAGQTSADDFMGRVLLAQGLNQEDGGRPAFQEGNITDCGRRDGYYEDILNELSKVAHAAQALDTSVVWS